MTDRLTFAILELLFRLKTWIVLNCISGLGEARAKTMCPLGLLEQLGVKMALHSDFTMAPAAPLVLAWCAVNRVTLETGQCNQPGLCISPYTALRGQFV